jgi:hypothetical protein
MKTLKLIAPILILTGTAGLLVNEFLLHWGRATTLTSAGVSTLGLIILGITCLWNQKQEEQKIN